MKFLISAILLASFSLAAHAEKVTVAIKGMHCEDCAESIQTKFKTLPNVKAASVNFKKKTMVLETAGKQDLTDEKIVAEVKAAGYETGKITRLN